MDDAPTDILLKWKIAFVVSEVNQCEYCVSVSKMQLKSMGLDNKAMDEIEKACNEKECMAIEYAEATATHSYKIDPKLIIKLKENFTDEQLMEITSVVGLFSYINRFNDDLQVFSGSNTFILRSLLL